MNRAMKNNLSILIAINLFVLTILFQTSANGQNPTLTPRRPGPVMGTPKGTATGGASRIVNSTLMIYTKNGVGTTSTETSGEFRAQLAATAAVGNDFALKWTRTRPGKAETANILVSRLARPVGGSYLGDGALSVTMPAGAVSVNIPFSFSSLEPDPNLPADRYELQVLADSGMSTKVTITYSGPSSTVVFKPGPMQNPAPAKTSGKMISKLHFEPSVGAPGEPGYKKAELTVSLVNGPVHTVEVEVWSQPYKNPEIITASGSKNQPIMIFKGKWARAKAADNLIITVRLSRTSKNEIKTEETGPGVYSPSDWGYAFAQTTTASFRWSVNGSPIGSTEQSPRKSWTWVAP